MASQSSGLPLPIFGRVVRWKDARRAETGCNARWVQMAAGHGGVRLGDEHIGGRSSSNLAGVLVVAVLLLPVEEAAEIIQIELLRMCQL